MLKLRWETEFKETEIGEIPRDWEKSEIGSFMVIRSGKRPKEVKVYGFYEVWGANGFMGYTDDTDHLENREVLITGRVGTLGNVYYIKKNSNVWLSDNVLILYPNDQEINLKFVFYHLLTRKEDIINLDVGSTQPLITQNGLKNLIIPLPPLPEQSRIATVLSYFDDLIENKKRQNEILEKTTMAIFKSWFIDFEPFRACPERERGNYDEFVYNEELGREIPKGWEVKKLGEVVKTQYGITISGENFGEIKLLRITDINKTFVIDWDSVPYCNLHEKMFYKYNLSDKDIVISRIADIGKVAIIEDPPKSVFASYLIRLKIKSDSNIKPYYLYYWLKSEIYQEYILGAGEGSTRENTNAEVIKDGPILIPDISILQKFEELACDLRSKIILNQKQIMTLRKIRDTLLPLLVFGKLRVEEI